MRGFLILLTILAAVLGLGYSAVAHAETDIDQFINDVHSLGWYGKTAGDGDLIRNGYIVCGMARDGYSLNEISRHIYVSTGLDVTFTDSAAFAATAIADLCPELYRGPVA